MSCPKQETVETATLFKALDAHKTGIDFTNHVENGKELNIFTYRNFYNGGGVAIIDINNDGLADVFFTANQSKNQLYLNKGDMTFKNITATAGIGGNNTWSTGVTIVDINADGLLDIYVCNAGNIKGDNRKNELFINNGDLSFTEKAEHYNLADSGLTTHTAFFDYDKDGDLDAYILNNSFVPVSALNYSNKREISAKDWNVPEVLKGGGDKLMRNDGGTFVDVNKEAGIYSSLIGFGLGITVGDINNDNYIDIYVSNDFYERDYLYINNQNGTFTESIKEFANHISQSSMGADIADINNDGNLDVFVTDMLPEKNKRTKETTLFENYDLYHRKQDLGFYHQYMQNTLQLNLGNNKFAEIGGLSGVSKTDWSWGALLFDMDNDGYKDIYICNGITQDLTNQDFMNFFANDVIQDMVTSGKKEDIMTIINKMPSTPIPNYAFKNNQDLTFKNATADWGFDKPSFSNGAAYADLDNDGDLDIVINNVNQKAMVYENNTNTLTTNKYIRVKLKGKAPNVFGVGSKIKLYSNNKIISQELIPSRGFQSSVDYTQTIGIGTKKIDSIHVLWPNDTFETITMVTANTEYVFKEEDATHKFVPSNTAVQPTYISKIESNLEPHNENHYVDFNYEGLIHQMLSKEGPTISCRDVNNDGLEDIFVGGAKGQEAKLYLQNTSGKFIVQKNQGFIVDKSLEDTASAFFDADNDGDIDLMIGTGGNEIDDEKSYRARLYLNDGTGSFSISKHAIPPNFNNTAIIAPYDFDQDGDMDVFIGSRSVPAVYAINAKHQLLQNNGQGEFRDITKNMAYFLKDLGMITDARWHDFDADNKKDLIITKDWGAPKIFKNTGKQLVPYKTNLSTAMGWWNVLNIADVNHDGLPDIILGNNGLNIPYKPSKENPLKIYINDFDNNGTIEQITTETINGKDFSITTKQELTTQISSLKKKNLKFVDYAAKSIDELFPQEILTQAMVREVNTSASVVALNRKDGKFDIIPLPIQVQFSSVNAIAVLDVNNDNHLDLLLGGNQYNFKPQYARLDANHGSLLLGNGKGEFDWVEYTKSGFFVNGEIKNIATIKGKEETMIIVGINNAKPQIFKTNHD